jgi:hypothetical protein
VYFAAFDEQVGDHLREPSGIAVHGEARSRHVDDQLVLLLLEQRAGSFDGSGHDFRDLDALLLQLDFAARDP